MIAVPVAPREPTVSPSPCAAPSTLPKPSRCSDPALVIRPMVGCASAISCVTSPMRFAPSSITALLCVSFRRISVSGTPMWLFKFPCVARQGPTRVRIAAIISFTVVLPLLPATAISGRLKFVRHFVARRCSAASVSATSICGSLRGRNRGTIAPAAPASAAAATNPAPSKFGPRSATNKAPACSVRLSVDTAA